MQLNLIRYMEDKSFLNNMYNLLRVKMCLIFFQTVISLKYLIIQIFFFCISCFQSR